jgi:hypothetical protein
MLTPIWQDITEYSHHNKQTHFTNRYFCIHDIILISIRSLSHYYEYIDKSQQLESKGFCRWCVTLSTTGFEDFVRPMEF